MSRRDIPRLLTPSARAAQRRVRHMREAVYGAMHVTEHLSEAERRRQKAIRGTTPEKAFQELFNDRDEPSEEVSP